MGNAVTRLRTHSQNNTIAASAQADRKISGRQSNRMATLRQSLMPPNMFSIFWPFLQRTASCGIWTFQFFFEGMHGVMFTSINALRNQSAS